MCKKRYFHGGVGGSHGHGSIGFLGSYKYPTLPTHCTSSSSHSLLKHHLHHPLFLSPSICNWRPVVSTNRPLLDAVACLREINFVSSSLYSVVHRRTMKMSASLGKSLRLSSPLKVEEEAKVVEKQGIVSILGSDCDTKAGSLRRTLSADMSSKKWLAQHGFSPMKKIASSEQFPISSTADSPYSSSEGEDDQLERPEQEQIEKPGQFDMWSSILCQKADEDSSKLPPPYIHPLVKRSTSSLSEKSLEVCTESLGSETGSDGFSSYPPSETGDVEEEETQAEPQEEEKESQFFDREELRVVKYNKKSLPKSFPPPLPSLARRDGPSVHMQCHRENGRLVLEAVSVPSQNYFHAQRQDGRLLLTLVNNHPQPQDKGKEEQFEEVFENEVEVEVEAKEVGEEEEDQEEEEEEEEMVDKENGEREMGIVMEQAPKQSSGVINVHRSAVMMKRLMGIDNRNRTWTQKFNKAVNLVKMEMEFEEEVSTQLPQSLPLRPRVGRLIPAPPAAAASFNAYEYFWRAKPSVATMINPVTKQCPPHKNNCNKFILSDTGPKANENEELVLLRGNKADYLVPLVRGCKEPRRSLLIWEPCCIATS